ISLVSDFFMRLQTALSSAFAFSNEYRSLEQFSALLDPALLEQAFASTGVATLRRRRLPIDAVLWTVIGMSLFRQESVWHIANRLDVLLANQQPLLAPSAVVQARQRLGEAPVRAVFEGLAHHSYQHHAFDTWCGLN